MQVVLRKLNPASRRPWPVAGDADMQTIYASVGQALSQWERCEAHLAMLFSALVTGMENDIARRAYCAVRTFEGRPSMLRAAATTYFHTSPDTELQSLFESIRKEASNYSERRHDIAHGVVFFWQPAPPKTRDPEEKTFALFPSAASLKGWAPEQPIPEYCYVAADIDYFYARFNDLTGPPSSLAGHIIRKK
jgi:hypothetical protein